MDLTEEGGIMKRWQENAELCKKGLHDSDNLDDVITHLEPDILECEIKWALGSITTKLVEVMEFQLSYFKSILHNKQMFKKLIDDGQLLALFFPKAKFRELVSGLKQIGVCSSAATTSKLCDIV